MVGAEAGVAPGAGGLGRSRRWVAEQSGAGCAESAERVLGVGVAVGVGTGQPTVEARTVNDVGRTIGSRGTGVPRKLASRARAAA
ncbi:hypothetical protein GCM10009774_20560 [Cellulomonas gelida]|uniref:Uncharacterized protein n=1 Tax=Cellulomonas gelida TaxID=1712 RepID=A0A4Y3KF95_9CELL|nr:hypothetical protein CGE01nite_03620 [Cellulomonas gelida]GGL30089.1 hypothetical protein GCM10009774_20560 [Cellulomonas gelida]